MDARVGFVFLSVCLFLVGPLRHEKLINFVFLRQEMKEEEADEGRCGYVGHRPVGQWLTLGF